MSDVHSDLDSKSTYIHLRGQSMPMNEMNEKIPSARMILLTRFQINTSCHFIEYYFNSTLGRQII